VAGSEAYLHAKFNLDPSNRLATINQRYRQDRQTGQRSDSIGRTVLQTVAPKSADFYAVFTVRFRNEQHMRQYERHPPQLINVATLACESQNTENVTL